MTRTAAPKSSANTSVAHDSDGLVDARAWVARQLRFEHLLGSLERRVATTINEVATGRQS